MISLVLLKHVIYNVKSADRFRGTLFHPRSRYFERWIVATPVAIQEGIRELRTAPDFEIGELIPALVNEISHTLVAHVGTETQIQCFQRACRRGYQIFQRRITDQR